MNASSAVAFSSGSDHRRRGTEHDDRAVVHRVLEDRPCEHDPVEERDGQAGGDPRGQLLERAARRRAVHVDAVADARVERRDDERLLVVDEAEVRHEPGVEHRVDRLPVVAAALGEHGARGSGAMVPDGPGLDMRQSLWKQLVSRASTAAGGPCAPSRRRLEADESSTEVDRREPRRDGEASVTGKVAFLCTVPGHAAAGTKGRLGRQVARRRGGGRPSRLPVGPTASAATTGRPDARLTSAPPRRGSGRTSRARRSTRMPGSPGCSARRCWSSTRTTCRPARSRFAAA